MISPRDGAKESPDIRAKLSPIGPFVVGVIPTNNPDRAPRPKDSYPGRCRQKVLPWSGWESAVTDPPWLSATRRAR